MEMSINLFFSLRRFVSLNTNIDCNSKDVIYLINDKVCKLSNVGCTTDSLKTRFSNHKSHIKFKKRTCEVSKHFSDCETLHDLDKASNKAFIKKPN